MVGRPTREANVRRMAGDRFRTVAATGVLATVLASALVLGGQRIATTADPVVTSPPPATASAPSFETRQVALSEIPRSDGLQSTDGWAIGVPDRSIPPAHAAPSDSPAPGGGSLAGESTIDAGIGSPDPAAPAAEEVDESDGAPPLFAGPASGPSDEPLEAPTVFAAGSGDRRVVSDAEPSPTASAKATPPADTTVRHDRTVGPAAGPRGTAERWRWHRAHEYAAAAAAAALRAAAATTGDAPATGESDGSADKPSSQKAHDAGSKSDKAPKPAARDEMSRAGDTPPSESKPKTVTNNQVGPGGHAGGKGQVGPAKIGNKGKATAHSKSRAKVSPGEGRHSADKAPKGDKAPKADKAAKADNASKPGKADGNHGGGNGGGRGR